MTVYVPGIGTLPPLNQVALAELGIAGGLIAASVFIALWLGGKLTPFATRLIHDADTADFKLVAAGVRGVIRPLLVAILIATIKAAHVWTWYAATVLGIALALTIAVLVFRLLKQLRLGTMVAGGVAFVAFALIVTREVGRFSGVAGVLDRVGFDLGSFRISLLTIATYVLAAIVLIAVVRLAIRLVRHFARRNTRIDPAQQVLVEKLGAVVIVVLAFFIGIDMLGIDITAFAVFSGALGLAIGFGLQKSVGNLFAGILLLMDRSIKPGDVIAVGDSFGWVNKIGMRAVSIITRDGKEHLIPNELLMTEEVENWSYSSPNVRVHIEVGVSYSSDLRLAQELMREAAGELARVLNNPKPIVWIKEFGDLAVVFDIRVWIKDPQGGIGNMRHDVLQRVWDKFKENGIELPFPQRDINLRTIDDAMIDRIAEKVAARAGSKTGKAKKVADN